MDDSLRSRLQAIFDRIEGGSTDDMVNLIDSAIEDGEITQEEFQAHEIEICHFFDDHWFTCSQCSWTMPISELSCTDGDLLCSDCNSENENGED